MDRRRFFKGSGPAIAAAALAPIALLSPKPPLPDVTDDFQLKQGDIMTAETMDRHIDVRAAHVVRNQLVQLRKDGLI